MVQIRTRYFQSLMILALLFLFSSSLSLAQQVPDPNFNSKVAHPAYVQSHPRVLFDAAHNNFHTATGGYKPFADLIKSDGYLVTSNKEKFSMRVLKGYDILIIVNAMGAARMDMPGAGNPAFADEECDAVRDWVKGGGALLLIADHYPVGGAAEILAKRFGVEMGNGVTGDKFHYDEAGDPSWLVYTRENKLLTDTSITRGRDASEKIDRVVAFTGQSLKGPKGSVAFLRLADVAMDLAPPDFKKEVSAAGRAQGLALTFGKGRVIVLGEASMLTAQLGGTEKEAFGMNRPGNDDRQLALNIMHWLSGLLAL